MNFSNSSSGAHSGRKIKTYTARCKGSDLRLGLASEFYSMLGVHQVPHCGFSASGGNLNHTTALLYYLSKVVYTLQHLKVGFFFNLVLM